jgi:hypothetical protein
MIAALLAVFFLLFMSGGLASQLADIDDQAKEHVAEKARREIIIDASKTLNEELEKVVKSLDEHFGELVDVNADYASTESDFDAVRAKLKTDQTTATQAVLDARDKMHKQMTREEWSAVFASEN